MAAPCSVADPAGAGPAPGVAGECSVGLLGGLVVAGTVSPVWGLPCIVVAVVVGRYQVDRQCLVNY